MPPPHPPAKSHFKNTMGNLFFDYFKYWLKRSKKIYNRNMDILISNGATQSVLNWATQFSSS